MRICLLSDQYKNITSGIGVYTNNLVEGLKERGHQVILITNEQPSSVLDGIINIKRPAWDITHGAWFSLGLYTKRIIRKLHSRFKFDIFHSLDTRQGGLAAKELKGLCPTIGSINDYYFTRYNFNPVSLKKDYPIDWFRRWVYNNFTHTVEKNTIKNYDAIISNSQKTSIEIETAYNIKSTIVYKALPVFPAEPVPCVFKPRGDYLILMAGKNLQRKGIVRFLSIIPSIIKAFPNIRFCLAGDERVHKIIQKRNLEQYFMFVSFLKPEILQKLYRQIDLCVLPSLVEGFGLVVLEAMSNGLPVVGFMRTGMEDIIQHTRNGILAYNNENLLYYIVKLLSQNKYREAVGLQAFKDAKKYNTDTQIKEHLEIYENLKK